MLHWYFAQSKKATDFVGEIVHQFRENESQTKSRADVVQQLYRQEIIKRDAFDELMSKEMPGFCDRLLMGAQMQSSAPNSAHDNDTLAIEIQVGYFVNFSGYPINMKLSSPRRSEIACYSKPRKRWSGCRTCCSSAAT